MKQGKSRSKYAQKYKEISLIGRGTQGSAMLIENIEDGRRFVSKKVVLSQLGEKDQKAAIAELSFLREMKHPNIVKFIEGYKEKNKIITVMEFCECGDLSSFIRQRASNNQPLDEELILQWFVQLCQGLLFIHSKKIIHRDIKSSNVFISKNNYLKIGDFGISRQLSHTLDNASTLVGTPNYMSPEVCQNKPYTTKSDMWSLGCLLYELCTLHLPFQSNNLMNLVVKIVKEKTPKIPSSYSPKLTEFINALLRKNPDKRPSAIDILNSPTIKRIMQEFVLSNQQKDIKVASEPTENITKEKNKEDKKKPGAITLLEKEMQEKVKKHQESVRQELSKLYQTKDNQSHIQNQSQHSKLIEGNEDEIAKQERQIQEQLERIQSEVRQSYRQIATPQRDIDQKQASQSKLSSENIEQNTELALSCFEETVKTRKVGQTTEGQDEDGIQGLVIDDEANDSSSIDADSELISSEGEREMSEDEEEDEEQEHIQGLDSRMSNLKKEEIEKKEDKENKDDESDGKYSPSMALDLVQNESILLSKFDLQQNTNQTLQLSQIQLESKTLNNTNTSKYPEIENIPCKGEIGQKYQVPSNNNTIANGLNETSGSLSVSLTADSVFMSTRLNEVIRDLNLNQFPCIDEEDKNSSEGLQEGKNIQDMKISENIMVSQQKQDECGRINSVDKNELNNNRQSNNISQEKHQIKQSTSSQNLEKSKPQESQRMVMSESRGRSRIVENILTNSKNVRKSIDSKERRQRNSKERRQSNSKERIPSRELSRERKGSDYYADDFEQYEDEKEENEEQYSADFEEYVEGNDSCQFDCHFMYEDENQDTYDSDGQEYSDLDSILNMYKSQLLSGQLSKSINNFELTKISEESISHSSLLSGQDSHNFNQSY